MAVWNTSAFLARRSGGAVEVGRIRSRHRRRTEQSVLPRESSRQSVAQLVVLMIYLQSFIIRVRRPARLDEYVVRSEAQFKKYFTTVSDTITLQSTIAVVHTFYR